MQTHLAELAIRAAQAVVHDGPDGPGRPDRVKTLTQTGEHDRFVVETGLVLGKVVSDRMPKHIGSGKALVDGGLERREMMSNLKLNLTDQRFGKFSSARKGDAVGPN